MTIEERIEFLMQSIESHDRQIGELTDQIGELKNQIKAHDGQIGELRAMTGQVLTSVATLASTVGTLADVANNHERRITRIEGTP
jgi:ABC-type transporter Mla subunit MlaD